MTTPSERPAAHIAGYAIAAPETALSRLITHPLFERVVLAAIVVNAITLGLETSPSIMARIGLALHLLDDALLAFFVVEIALRLVAFGRRFWRDPWSLFDLAVIAVTLLPASGNLSILRSLRILRALRLITAIPSIRRVVGGLLASVPSMGSIILLLLLINYVYSVMATKLFAADFEAEFGTLGASFFTFFQIMTLEGWADISRRIMEKHPWAWMFFVPYIVLATFMVLNLFIGIVVDALQQQNVESRDKVITVTYSEYEHLLGQITALRGELRQVKGAEGLPALDDAGPLPPPGPHRSPGA